MSVSDTKPLNPKPENLNPKASDAWTLLSYMPALVTMAALGHLQEARCGELERLRAQGLGFRVAQPEARTPRFEWVRAAPQGRVVRASGFQGLVLRVRL